MPAFPISEGFDLGPLLPKNRTSPGCTAAGSMRSDCPTSPLIAYVVLPLITPGSAVAPSYDWSLKTRQTSPEQSNPPGTMIVLPGAVALQSFCVFSDVPAKT